MPPLKKKTHIYKLIRNSSDKLVAVIMYIKTNNFCNGTLGQNTLIQLEEIFVEVAESEKTKYTNVLFCELTIVLPGK